MAQEIRDKKRAQVIDVLNKAHALELQAIIQYMHQHYSLADMDYGVLAANIKLIALDEMNHAEMFAERVKELDGEPITEPAGPSERRQDVRTIFAFDAKLEDDAIAAYNQFLLVCRENGDSTSVKLFEAIIDEEQIHFNYFDNVSAHIQKLGETYLAQIAGTPSDIGPETPGFVARQAAGGAQGGAAGA